MKSDYVFANLLLILIGVECIENPFIATNDEVTYSTFLEKHRLNAKAKTREMFDFAWNSYIKYAYPADELDPINCRGRGADHQNPDNININDALGDYSLTLIDSLDSLVVFGYNQTFKKYVQDVIDNVSFKLNTTVQVFESTIRVMGSLLSAHLIASDINNTFGHFYMPEYKGELLTMAHELATRLLPAFENTNTGIPFTRVNLERGVLPGTTTATCTAGAGSLLLEFGILSRLIGDDRFESLARKVNARLWQLRTKETGLHGNLIDIHTGHWLGHMSGLGAGIDSFYEYMLKSYIVLGDKRDLVMFNESLKSIMEYMRVGRRNCTRNDGEPPIFVNVDRRDGSVHNTWMDALQASFSGVLLLAGHLEEAICHHSFYYAIWKKFGVLPERFNWKLQQPDVSFYPLRPEFVESTYLLYQATKNPFYLNVGLEIIHSLETITKTKCGYATVHNVLDGSLEDRMESFFLSETLKYLYLLFDVENPVNKNQENLVFSTEAHFFIIDDRLRKRAVNTTQPFDYSNLLRVENDELKEIKRNQTCETLEMSSALPPLRHDKMRQLFDIVDVKGSHWN